MKTVTLNVEKSETIKNLKGMVHEKEGTSEDIQDLFFAGDRLMNGRLIDYGVSVSDLIMNYAGKLLEDCKTLAFYDIKEE
ncbi:hypothetical protein WN943_029111 [Citrus x changshan-huyou]